MYENDYTDEELVCAEEVKKQIGDLIRERRKEGKISQMKLANLARTVPCWICRMENGDCNPSINNLAKVLTALDMKIKIETVGDVNEQANIK